MLADSPNRRAQAVYDALLVVFAALYPVDPANPNFAGHYGHCRVWNTFIIQTLRKAMDTPDPV